MCPVWSFNSFLHSLSKRPYGLTYFPLVLKRRESGIGNLKTRLKIKHVRWVRSLNFDDDSEIIPGN